MKSLSLYFRKIQKVVIISIITSLAACSSLPSLPGQIRWVDRTKESKPPPEPAPVDSKLLNQYWNKGTQHFQKGEWQPAISEFSSALELMPNNAKILVARGWSYAKVDQVRLAWKDFNQSLQHEELIEAHIGIAELAKAALSKSLRGSEVFDAMNEGRLHYKRAIEMQPNNEYLYYGLATMQYMHHHNKYSSQRTALGYPLREVQRAIQLKPDFVEALILEAIILSELGQEEEAARAADRVLALKPDFAEAHYIRGLVMSRTQNRTRAVAFARRALQLDPGNWKYRRAIDEWQSPAPLTPGQIAGVMSAMLLGAFLTSDSAPYNSNSSPAYDPWGPSGYLNNWHNSIMSGL